MNCKNCGHEIEKVKGHYNHKTAKKHIGKILSFPCHEITKRSMKEAKKYFEALEIKRGFK